MSERVLHEWVGERALRIVQDDFGFRCQVLNRDGDWLPTTAWEDEWLPEFNALAARVAELEAENAKLKEGLDRLVRIYNERTDEVDKVREERNEAEYEAVELRAENANLLAALLDLYNAHQNKKLEAAMRSTGRWTQIKGMVGDANDEAFRALGVEVDK